MNRFLRSLAIVSIFLLLLTVISVILASTPEEINTNIHQTMDVIHILTAIGLISAILSLGKFE